MDIQKQFLLLPAAIALGGGENLDVAVGVPNARENAQRASGLPAAGPIKQIEDAKDEQNAN